MKQKQREWGDPGDHCHQHLASISLRKPNKSICVCCRAQAPTESEIKHVEGCPATKTKVRKR